jgi:hypothetical protein
MMMRICWSPAPGFRNEEKHNDPDRKNVETA